MDFTEIYKQSGHLVAFSPGAHFLLTAIHDRLLVRRADSFQITRSWQLDPAPNPTTSTIAQHSSAAKLTTSRRPLSRTPDSTGPVDRDAWISHLAWSADSEYILAASAKRGLVDIFKIRDDDWRARIHAGAEGLVKAEWAPDARTVVCWSEWAVRSLPP